MKAKVIGAVVAFLLADGAARAAITIETIPVGNAGNAADTKVRSDGTSGYGSVPYTYNIGKYGVTAGQYCAFLNAVAKTDPYGLYNTEMAYYTYGFGCMITRHGTSGNYAYDFSSRPSGTESDCANRPVNYVSWGDAARFANWLHNGQPTTGVEDLTTTEDGSYYLNGAMSNTQLMAISRKADWKWAITSENEWYKAAYYKGGSTTAGYWEYPTSSNKAPGTDLADVSGNNANCFNIGLLIGMPYYRTPVNQFKNSASPCGTFDQAGNVWEWNEAIVSGSYRGRLGSSFMSFNNYTGASSRIGKYVPTYEINDLGFRVSEVPEPATLSLLALLALSLPKRGGVALLRSPRRPTAGKL